VKPLRRNRTFFYFWSFVESLISIHSRNESLVLILSNKWELLREGDEELQMLRETAEEYTRQQSEKTPEKKSGDATEIVVRNHLQNHDLNVSPNCVYVNPSNREIDLLILKEKINRDHYSPNEVHTVIEIRNNAVGSAERNPNVIIRNRFDDIENLTKVNRFAVIVLSEKLPSTSGRKPYKWRIQEKEIGKKNCRVFTLVARERWDRLYEIDVVNKMLENGELRKTGEWEKLIAYLKE